jgi:glycosyltransferase involved in cell wall biosynthesis
MSGTKGRIVMAEFSDARFDARVLRQARALASDGWSVSLIMYREDITSAQARVDAGATMLEYPMPGRYRSARGAGDAKRKLAMLGTALRMAWRCMTTGADVYHAHNFVLGWALWLGAALRHARFVYDAHEVAWDEPQLHFRVGTHVEGFLLRHADVRIAPSEDRARLIAEHYGVRRPIAIGNYPDMHQVERGNALRARLGIPADTAILYYSGAFSTPTRLQASIVRALPSLENAVFVLVGTSHPAEREMLESLARSLGVAQRLIILGPLPHNKLLALTASADIGISLLRDDGLAYRYHALNKFYEYAASGVAILASDMPTFRREVLELEGGPIGDVCNPDDTTDVVRALSGLLADRHELAAMGRRARAMSQARWSWSREQRRLRETYDALAAPIREHVLVANP